MSTRIYKPDYERQISVTFSASAKLERTTQDCIFVRVAGRAKRYVKGNNVSNSFQTKHYPAKNRQAQRDSTLDGKKITSFVNFAILNFRNNANFRKIQKII